MRALVVYICTPVDVAVGGGHTASMSPMAPKPPTTESRSDSMLTQVVESGSCGLCAYVDEHDTPLQQFFRGLVEVKSGERDTTSHVMRLGQAPSAWVLGPGLPSSGLPSWSDRLKKRRLTLNGTRGCWSGRMCMMCIGNRRLGRLGAGFRHCWTVKGRIMRMARMVLAVVVARRRTLST
jgi:hypothetical protein